MGLRYRKSINLGGGFRINLSKSGIGYSWGTKGYRITKKAGGGTRTTYSIPGTGLSWVEEGGKSGKSRNRGNAGQNMGSSSSLLDANVLYQAGETDASQLVTDNTQDFVNAVKHYAACRKLLKWFSILSFALGFLTPVFWGVFVICIICYMLFAITRKIPLEYECDEYGNRRIQMLNLAVNLLTGSQMIWQVTAIQRNSSIKTNAGASNSVTRKRIRIYKKKPYFLKTNAVCYYVKLATEEVFALPDRLVVKGKKGWGTVAYEELEIKVSSVKHVEDVTPPKDAAIIGYTWQFVNKDGSPDKRYKNNRRLPWCNYGTIAFKSTTGLDVLLYVSNRQNALDFKISVGQMIAEEKQMRLAVEKEMKEREQQKTKEMAHENVIQEIQQTNRDVSQETKSLQVDTHCDLDGFVLKNADSSETAILQNFCTLCR